MLRKYQDAWAVEDAAAEPEPEPEVKNTEGGIGGGQGAGKPINKVEVSIKHNHKRARTHAHTRISREYARLVRAGHLGDAVDISLRMNRMSLPSFFTFSAFLLLYCFSFDCTPSCNIFKKPTKTIFVLLYAHKTLSVGSLNELATRKKQMPVRVESSQERKQVMSRVCLAS